MPALLYLSKLGQSTELGQLSKLGQPRGVAPTGGNYETIISSRVNISMFIGILLVLWANAAQAEITGTVTSPAGGEMWAGSSTHDIVWETSGGSSTHTAEL